jgi:protein phosphatase
MAHPFIEVAALSDVGNVRQYNEDSLAVDVENGILALADGMGGHRAGEVASRLATESLRASLTAALAALEDTPGAPLSRNVIEESIYQANSVIRNAGSEDPKCAGMGTTLVLAVIRNARVTLAHVGDSRIYRVRAGHMRLFTRDDSLVRDQVELGVISAEEASRSHNRSLVTRALGIADTVTPHVADDTVVPGDIYLLCSDGLNDLVPDADIELIVASLASNLTLAAHHLVQAAKDNGGFDNVSVILARIHEAGLAPARRGWWAGFVRWLTGH